MRTHNDYSPGMEDVAALGSRGRLLTSLAMTNRRRGRRGRRCDHMIRNVWVIYYITRPRPAVALWAMADRHRVALQGMFNRGRIRFGKERYWRATLRRGLLIARIKINSY